MAGEQIDLEILRRAALVSAQINQGRGLDNTLQAVADGVVEAVGFGAAAVNYVLANGDLRTMAVAGPQEAREALIGRILPREVLDRLLAQAEPWGALRFITHGRIAQERAAPSWTPDVVVADIEDAWHADDSLLVPLHGSDGTLVGILSVDLPPGQRRPNALLCELLEIFAVQAGLAIDKARIVTQLRDEHARLAVSEAAFRFSFTGSAGAMAMLSLDVDDPGRFEQVNEAFCQAVGYRRDELIGLHWTDLVVPAQRSASEATLLRLVAGQEGAQRSERQMIRRDGAAMWAGLTFTVIAAPDAEVPPFLLTHFEDITDRKQYEALLAHQAQVDPLTGLANRRLLIEYLEAVLADTVRAGPSGFVFYADLDQFKQINDRHGHATGDLVLRETAERLKAQVRAGDVVARLGGDEFVIVATDLDRDEADRITARIHTAFARPLTIVDETVTISLGMAQFDAATTDAETLLCEVDRYMYAHKRRHVSLNGHRAAGGGRPL